MNPDNLRDTFAVLAALTAVFVLLAVAVAQTIPHH